jgi:hypothetical protein
MSVAQKPGAAALMRMPSFLNSLRVSVMLRRRTCRAFADPPTCWLPPRPVGDGQRSISGALDADGHRVMIFGGPARSTMDLLYGPHGLSAPLQDQSTTRCFSVSELEAAAWRRGAPTGRHVSFELRRSLDLGMEMAHDWMVRYQAGCAVITDVRAARNGRDLVVYILQKR